VTWGSQSELVPVKVRHIVSLAPADAGSPDDSGIYHYPASVPSVSFTGSVVPAHIGRAVTIRVQRIDPLGSYIEVATGAAVVDEAGNFSFTLVRPDPGVNASYVAVARMAKDDLHAFGASAPVTFVTDL
jgi:hypothetical protein